ncbi:E3 ubiquitin-protein ligase MARCHF8-like [Ornithodoros turicata]|uniref:E3 ubiquitin-protein ligase MARCHF8-like n=1 Tax=Ornithodoros turicata TaxID=34597 RepID=UPI003138C443
MDWKKNLQNMSSTVAASGNTNSPQGGEAQKTPSEPSAASEESLVQQMPQQEELCRFCAMGDQHEALITPCNCEGIISQSHQSCLEKRILQNGLRTCSLCDFKYQYRMKRKPLRNWLQASEHRDDVFQLSMMLTQYTCDLTVIILASITGLQFLLQAPFVAAIISAFVCSVCIIFWSTYLINDVWKYARPLRKWMKQNTVVVLRVPKRDIENPDENCDSTVELGVRD